MAKSAVTAIALALLGWLSWPVSPEQGYDAFAAAVSAQLPRWGGQRRNLRIPRHLGWPRKPRGGVDAERAAA